MDSRTGKKIRMGRLFNPQSGNSIIVAYSHGVLMGPRPGMMTLGEMQRVAHSVSQAEGLLISPGMVTHLEDAFVGKDRPSLLIHMDYQNFSRSILPYREGSAVELATVEQVVAAGADGVMTYLSLGFTDPEREKVEVERNARLARACEQWGLVLMIEALTASKDHPEDQAGSNTDLLVMACRIAAEIGADIVKCIYPGSTEALVCVVSSCPVPILLAGGPRDEIPEKAYERAKSGIEAGARGLVFGRNIFESDDPAAELARFHQIVHRGFTPRVKV